MLAMAAICPSSSPQYSNSKANLMLSSGIIQKAWACISGTTQQASLSSSSSSSSTTQLPFPCWEFHKSRVVVFNAATAPPAQGADGSSSSTPLVPVDRSGQFGFLITEDNSSISLHRSALSCFDSLLPRFKEQFRPYLQKQEEDKPKLRPLILVGHSLGGSVAALFTLWLLKNRHSSVPRPICVTFGSPFIGDEGLAKAISKYEQWKAGFWHVLSLHGDDHPRISTSIEQQFRPFGTYFLCSESAFFCPNDPNSVLELLQHSFEESTATYDYGQMLSQHKQRAIYGDRSTERSDADRSRPGTNVVPLLAAMVIKDNHPAYASIAEALKVEHSVPQNTVYSSKALYERKKQMARLEWYKKTLENRDKGKTYYDVYKARGEKRDIDVGNEMIILLKMFWKEEVKKAENKPHTPDFPLRDKYLFAGTNYRRLVEPLDIANYYKKSDLTSSYMTAGERDHHFVKLEELERIDSAQRAKNKSRERAASLTEDSCFWARVEEARRSLKRLNEGAEGEQLKLQEFEEYVMELIDKLALSPEVFRESSTFMKWWEEYEQNRLPPDSQFTEFLKEKRNDHSFYSQAAVNR